MLSLPKSAIKNVCMNECKNRGFNSKVQTTGWTQEQGGQIRKPEMME